MKPAIAIAVVMTALCGCTKNDKSTLPPHQPDVGEAHANPEPITTPGPDTDPPATQPDAANQEKPSEPTEAERVAQRVSEFERDHAEEMKRWNEEMSAAAAKLAKTRFKNPRAALVAILASEHRKPSDRERDKYRHPLDTLLFFGIKQNMTVVEVGSGGGWYTDILAPFLAPKGKLVAVTYDPEGADDSMRTAYGKRFAMFLARSPELYGKVEAVYVNPPEDIELGAPGSADMALAIREMHGWQRNGAMDAYLAAVHAVLKNGGTFGVVQHRAPKGSDPEATAEKGYLPQDWLVDKVESAGFKLVKSSEINANPKDTKDYAEGVWTLPPNLRLGETDRDKYMAIGESDRMTLKFVKKAR